MKGFNQKWTVQDWINAVNEESSESVDAINELFSLNIEKHQKIKAIVGESPYPNNPLTVKNGYLGFPEIAFLKTEYTLDLVSISSILFDSMDAGIKFLKSIENNTNQLDKRKLLVFAKLLFVKERIILINRNDAKSHYRNKEFASLLNYLDKVLIIGITKQRKDFLKAIRSAKISALKVVHPSSRCYPLHASKCIKTFFQRSIPSQNGVSLNDFKIV